MPVNNRICSLNHGVVTSAILHLVVWSSRSIPVDSFIITNAIVNSNPMRTNTQLLTSLRKMVDSNDGTMASSVTDGQADEPKVALPTEDILLDGASFWEADQPLVCSPSKRMEQKKAQTASYDELIKESRLRNVRVAIVSVVLAITNFVWQYSHPVTEVQLLMSMQQSSVPMSLVGNNGKPSVVDFWAPWCENCKFAAPTLRQVEDEYRDRVNFVMVNCGGDDDMKQAWPYLEAFRVDAIPHLALVSADGVVETSLIGPTPKSVLEADLNTLLENAKQTSQQEPHHQALPYVMLDVFANSPELRKVHFEE